MTDRIRAVINTQHAHHNFQILKSRLDQHTKTLCVVKANGYGHGAIPLAHLWAREGADMFAVATAEEAFSLRNGGITKPCLVLGHTSSDYALPFAMQDILPTIHSAEDATMWNNAAKANGISLACHIKIDIGMHRIGFDITRAIAESLAFLKTCTHLQPTGFYTHLPEADTNPHITEQQFLFFKELTTYAKQLFGPALLCHAANTEACLRYPHMHMHMVRAGIGLYGLAEKGTPGLKPLMQLEASVIQVREIPKNTRIGYGGKFVTTRNSRIATISAGYADGIDRRWGTNRLPVFINGTPCPVSGAVCMDMCMADVTHIDHIKAGDTAIFFGYEACQSAALQAKRLNTIPYELLTSVSARVPRIYI